jgi:hypothetical protein
MRFISLALLLFSISFNACFKAAGPEKISVESQPSSIEALNFDSRQKLKSFLQAYVATFGSQNPDRVRAYLSAALKEIWGEKTIENLAFSKPIDPEEVVLLDAYSRNDRWIFQWKLKTSASSDLPWYFVNTQNPKNMSIENVTFDFNPLSSDR